MPVLELIIAAVLFIAVILYALLAGADFGGGMWDMLAFGPRARQQREAIAAAIGPVWEANHVWLILVLVVLFVAFAPAFAVIMTALHIPMTLILIGIVLRGSVFIFRKYDAQDDATHRRWSTIFGVSSFLTPFFLGITLGGLATGDIQVENGQVVSGFFAGWTTPFAIACGLFAQGLFAFLAAVYLTVDTKDQPELQADFRWRALASGLSLAPAAGLVFFLARDGAPYIFSGLTSWWSPVLLVWTSIFAVGALVALWLGRFALARIMAAGQITLILAGWGLAQYPYLVVDEITFAGSASPEPVLRLMVIALGVGAVILFPSMGYLFYIFKGKGDLIKLSD